MAESLPSGEDVDHRRENHRASSGMDLNEEIGQFAHRLSLDVTHDALKYATCNESGTKSDINDLSCDGCDRPQSLPSTPGSGNNNTDHQIVCTKCRKKQRRSKNPVVKIRDVSRTLVKWLRIRSKSTSRLNGEKEEDLRRKKSSKGSKGDPSKRALPPVPPADRISSQPEQHPVPESIRGFATDDLRPGEGYYPYDEDDDDPVPNFSTTSGNIDFAASIERVKDYGWYWGPISGEAAERLLLNEPDGSFVVRDSSDDHYIFSLTFKLNSVVRHVRIEHDQGNFSFGSLTKFKSNTIVDFIENAVEHSRSGRFLFFLHRRPVYGPMRVQLLHPVSRFKQVQSLQHQCRFVILKLVPRDLLHQLPVPKRIQDYLNTPFYYCEAIADWTEDKSVQGASLNDTEADDQDSLQASQLDGEALDEGQTFDLDR